MGLCFEPFFRTSSAGQEACKNGPEALSHNAFREPGPLHEFILDGRAEPGAGVAALPGSLEANVASRERVYS